MRITILMRCVLVGVVFVSSVCSAMEYTVALDDVDIEVTNAQIAKLHTDWHKTLKELSSEWQNIDWWKEAALYLGVPFLAGVAVVSVGMLGVSLRRINRLDTRVDELEQEVAELWRAFGRQQRQLDGQTRNTQLLAFISGANDRALAEALAQTASGVPTIAVPAGPMGILRPEPLH